MDKNELFEKLNENLENLDNVDKEIGMIELAIYQKTIEQLKNNKINEIRNFFEQQAKIYNQNSKKYEKEIENNIKKYEEQIEKLVNVYDELYINIFKIMQNAKDNEKIAIANIVTLSDRLQKEKNIEQQLQKNIIACIQKKLNYSVIIDECKARIEWCIENVKEDINQIFIIEANQLQLYKENIVSKIRRIIFNKISGKSRCSGRKARCS